MTYPKIKIGLMGCGTVANYGHLPAISAVPELQLNALFDPDEHALESTRAKFNAPFATTDMESFFQSDIDAVAITSSAPAHFGNVLAAAKHGKPVLCEKPLAMDQAQGRQMIEAMKQAKLPLFVGFTYRFSPAAITIRELVQKHAIGKVLDLRLIYLWDVHGKFVYAPDGSRSLNQRRLGRMLEGGPMVDCGTHQIDLARWWLASDIARQQAIGVWVDEYEVPDHMYLHMDHTNGAHTLVEMSYSYGHTLRETRPQFKYELIGTDGLILYDREAKLFELRNATGVTTLPFHEEKNFQGMYCEFAQAVRTGNSAMLATAEDGVAATEIALNAVQDAVRHRRRL